MHACYHSLCSFHSCELCMYALHHLLPTSVPYYMSIGDFDSTGSTNTMLKHLLEQRTIGNREFLPLSGQALLGFRLLPGAVRI